MYSVTHKEQYENMDIKMQQCCDMPIPFGFHTWFIGLFPIGHTVMCVNCRRKARGFTLEGSVKRWNKKLEKEKQNG